MKNTKTFYWIFTGLFAAAMLFSSIPDILVDPKAVTFMTALQYPTYIIPFLGVAKLLGVIAIIVPGFPRLKEWAYAGLLFDLIGAMYSQIANGGAVSSLGMLIFIALWLLSYIYYHKKIKAV